MQDRLIKQAAELQSRTIYGDEVIIEQQAFLAALGLTEQQIGSTINAAIQLSAALGIDLNSAVRNLAKTYSGLAGELGESIPALRNLTAEEMKAGGAIAYVNDNYKGFAETAAQTGMGPLQQLKNALGDLAEQFGKILVPIIQKLATKLKEIAEKFQQLSPRTREIITTVAAVAAATGPLLVAGGKLITGLKTVIALLPALGAALTTLAANPIGATVAGLSAIALALASIRRESNALEEGRSQGVQTRMTEAYNLARKMYENASDAELQRVLAEYKEMLNREGNYYASSSGGRMTQAQVDSLAGLQSTIKAIEEIIAKREDEKRILDSIKVVTTEISTETAKVARDRSKIDVSGADLSALTTVGAPKEAPLQMMLNNFNSAMWREKLMAEAEKIAALNKSIGAIVESSIEDVLVGLGEGIGNLISGTNFDPLKLLLNVLGNMLQQLGKALIAYAVSLEAVKTALKSMNPWLAGAAGVAAIATGTALINLANKPVKLATGGLAYGPTLAVVGDNPGASSDPEVVAPLSKLRNYIGGQRLELVGDVTFELSGDKLRATLNRENVRLASLA